MPVKSNIYVQGTPVRLQVQQNPLIGTDPWRRRVLLTRNTPLTVSTFPQRTSGPRGRSRSSRRGNGMVDNATGACATRSLAKDEARGRDCPCIGTRIVVEPCDDLIKPVAEPFGRNADL